MGNSTRSPQWSFGGTADDRRPGRPVDSAIGVLIIIFLHTGFNILACRRFWQKVAIGLVILVAVLVDQLRQNARPGGEGRAPGRGSGTGRRRRLGEIGYTSRGTTHAIRRVTVKRTEEISIKEARLRGLMKKLKVKGILLKTQANFCWFTAGGINEVTIADTLGVTSILVTERERFILSNRIEAPRMMEDEGLSKCAWRSSSSNGSTGTKPKRWPNP